MKAHFQCYGALNGSIIYIRSIFPTIGRANGPGGNLYFHFLMSLLIIKPVISPIRTVLMVNQLRIVSSILFLYQLCLKERKKNACYQLGDNCIQNFHYGGISSDIRSEI